MAPTTNLEAYFWRIIMITSLKENNLKSLYDTDYLEWLDKNIELLKNGSFNEVDLENIIEELESLGKQQKRALKSDLCILLMHLLKWDFQPQKRSSRWKYTIIEHRRRVLRDLADIPSLKPYFEEILELTYLEARKDTSAETNLPLNHFPETNPYSTEELFNKVLEPVE